MTDDTQITWQDNDPRMDEMAAWVCRLVRALRKAAPGNALAEKALDDLKRRGLLGDVLREAEEPDPLHVANERGEGEDAKDAARYRWLRDRLPWTLMSAHGYTRMAARLPVSIKADMDEAHEMDAALGAAMASGLSAIAQALAAAPKEKP